MINVISAVFRGAQSTTTRNAYQYDYGQVLKTNLALPETYEVQFSNNSSGGVAITQIGNADGVTIPDQMFISGAPIYAWIFLHQGADDGETVYFITIPVTKRAKPTSKQPTPVQKDAITQAIAALNSAVEQTGQDVEDANNAAESARESADAFEGMIAEEYDENKTYTIGDYSIHNDVLYRCTTAITTAESWTAAHWTAAVLGDDVCDLKSAINVLWTKADPSLIQGTYNTGTGVYVNNNRDATTQDFIADDIVSIEVPTAYQTRLYAWNKNGTYVGAQMSDGTFATSGTAGYFEKQDLESYRATYPNYLFKVVILKDNYSAIDIATEKSNFVFNSRVYATASEMEQANENIDNLLKLDNIADISVLWTDNYSLRASDGNINASSGNKVSDFIYVGTLRTIKYHLRLTNTSIPVLCKYDEERNFISAETISESGVQTGTVSGCVYVRFCTRMDYADNAVLVKTILTDRHDGDDLNRGSVSLDRLTGCKSDVFANLIDRTKITAQTYIDGTTGAPIANSGYAGVTDYIEVTPGTQYGWQYVFNTLFAFYNSNYEYISGSNSSNALANPFTAPANSAFVRLTLYSAADVRRCAVSPVSELARTRDKIQHIPVSVETISAQINPIHHMGKEFSTFTNCLCIGDSLTEGTFDSYDTPSVSTQISKYSYPSNLQKISGVECTNKGTSGMTTKTWYELHENDDLSGHDVCIIALGINDAYAGLPASTTKTYLNNIISKVQNENAGIRIFVVSCLPSHDHVTGYADVNTALKEVAESVSGCYFVDMDKYSELRKTSQYINGHLTAIGYNKEAQELYAYIGWIIFTQPEGFKEIQYIGQ